MQTIISLALRTPDDPCDIYIIQISLSFYDVVYQILVIGERNHPGGTCHEEEMTITGITAVLADSVLSDHCDSSDW